MGFGLAIWRFESFCPIAYPLYSNLFNKVLFQGLDILFNSLRKSFSWQFYNCLQKDFNLIFFSICTEIPTSIMDKNLSCLNLNLCVDFKQKLNTMIFGGSESPWISYVFFFWTSTKTFEATGPSRKFYLLIMLAFNK